MIDSQFEKGWTEIMKTRFLILTVLALTFVFAPPSPRNAFARGRSNYVAHLVSPKAGDVLKAGQVVRIAWTADFPDVALNMCETEVLISTDGGNVYNYITSQRNPKVQYYDWVVPATPTKTAILDIRFGCFALFPETPSPQIQASFTITE